MINVNTQAEDREPRLGVVAARGVGWGERLKALALESRLSVVWAANAREVRRLSGGLAAVVLPLDNPLSEWAELRADPALAATPLLGMATEASELAYAEVFARGGDDLIVPDAPGEVVAKLRALPPRGEAPGEEAMRSALVVGADAGWRSGTARRLRGAGFRVEFASDEAEARAALGRQVPTVVVQDGAGQIEASASLLAAQREAGREVAWVVSVEPSELGKARAVLSSQSGVAVHDAHGLADALPFVVNELTAGSVQERRRAPRVLFGTRVWVRAAGAEREQLGFTYTVSEGGLFVRSLVPFAIGTTVWVELVPPRVGRRVRLVATAVWSRGFGPQGKALSPPGTGLRIDGGLPGDWELFQQGCQALLDSPVERARLWPSMKKTRPPSLRAARGASWWSSWMMTPLSGECSAAG